MRGPHRHRAAKSRGLNSLIGIWFQCEVVRVTGQNSLTMRIPIDRLGWNLQLAASAGRRCERSRTKVGVETAAALATEQVMKNTQLVERSPVQTRSTASTADDPLDDLVTDDEWTGEVVDKYRLCDEFARGGMASICLGQLKGAAGFTRMVAIKRLHAQYARDEEFVARFKDEARLAARVLHPNVAQVLDLLESQGELLLVMEYVHGVNLRAAQLDAVNAGKHLPLGVIGGILIPALQGLHAAHETVDDDGSPLNIVHRDFSPQNVIVGYDGHTKIVDFGVAQAARQQHVTLAGSVSGKLGFMSPEQISCEVVDRRTDVFAAGIVLWEALTGVPLFRRAGQTDALVLRNVLEKPVPKPSSLRSEVPSALDDIVLRALERAPELRFQTALELGNALTAVLPQDTPDKLASWLARTCSQRLLRATQLFTKARLRSGRAEMKSTNPAVTAPASIRFPDTRAPSVRATRLSTFDSVRASARPYNDTVLEPIEDPSAVSATSSAAKVLGEKKRSWSDGLVTGVTVMSLLATGVILLSAERHRTGVAGQLPAPPATPAGGGEATRDREPTPQQAPTAENVVLEPSPSSRQEAASGQVESDEQPRDSGETPASADTKPAAPTREDAEDRSKPGSVDASRKQGRTARGKSAARRTATASSAPPSPQRTSDCAPPTYWDADNIQRFKKGCI